MRRAGYRVFVSHAHANLGVAQLVASVIEGAGADYILDKDHIAAGDDFCDWIHKNIRQCQELLVLVSPEFLHSQFLPYELGIASAHGLWVAPILYRVDIPTLRSNPIGHGILARRSMLSLEQLTTAYELQLRDRMTASQDAEVSALLQPTERKSP